MHERERSSWAYGIIVVVIVLFGAFWYYERNHDSDIETLPTPITSFNTIPASPREPDLGELQAAVINSAIPDYSKDF